MQKTLIYILLAVIFSDAVLWAAEKTACRPYTDEELTSIRASNNPSLIMGAGLISLLISPASTVGMDLLDFGELIEPIKGAATLSSIVYQLHHDSSLKPFTKSISRLLQDDKDNALSYYLNALLLQEEKDNKDVFAQIVKGNSKIFNGYSRQRFYSIVEAAEIAKCERIQARHYAFSNISIIVVYIKLRNLCKISVGNKDQDFKNACFHMGQNLERGSLTCIERLNSLSIQSGSLDDVPSNASALMEIKKKKDQALACGERRTAEISETDVTKDVDSHYYEILFKLGELAANDFLSDFVKGKK